MIGAASALADLGRIAPRTEILTCKCRRAATSSAEIPKAGMGLLQSQHGPHDQGDYDRGIADATKAIEIDPRLAMAYASRAGSLCGQGGL